MCEQVDIGRFAEEVSYTKLLAHLHNIEFTWFVPYDDNRADDGLQLRRRYGIDCENLDLQKYLKGPCTVLEMMVALAIRCEECIMDDTVYGDRTGQWFWGMIHNLGLTPMNDPGYDASLVDKAIERLLDREYEPDGTGGLFTIRNCDRDLRTVEIWRQLSWYLDSIMYD